MQKTTMLLAASLAALTGLSACGESEPEVVNDMYDPNQDAEMAELDPADVPPMVRASRSYRCDDNSVVYVTFYTNDAQVGVASDNSAPPTILQNVAMAEDAEADTGEDAAGDADAEAADGPVRFSGEGMTLVGTGDTITYPGQSCHA